MKLLLENWRKFLSEDREYSNQEKILDLLNNEDPKLSAQGMQLAPYGVPEQYEEAERLAVATVARSFDILEIMAPNKLGQYSDERYYYDKEDKDRLSALREKAKTLTTPEQLKVFIDEYLSFREEMKADYGFEDKDYYFPLNFMGHFPEDGIGAYPEMVKLVDMFGDKNDFLNHYVEHELKAVLKNYLSK
tara:strand:- start:357 stop:926 length:570 start_codon:yes stop_codon:yes gene_type:complete